MEKMSTIYLAGFASLLILAAGIFLGSVTGAAVNRVFVQTGVRTRLGAFLAGFPAFSLYFLAAYISLRSFVYRSEEAYRAAAPFFVVINDYAPPMILIVLLAIIAALLALIYGELAQNRREG